MRIGIDCHNLEGQRTGVGRYLANLLREWHELLESGFSKDVEFFLYFKNEIPSDIRSGSDPDQHGQRWKLRVLGARSNALFKHWSLPQAIAKDKIDVLFCPDYVLPFYVGCPTSHIKTAVALHDIIYEARPDEYSWPSWKDRILLKWASKQSAKKADMIFTPSEFTKSEVVKHYRISPDKIFVTPLAVDPIFADTNVLRRASSGLVKDDTSDMGGGWDTIKSSLNRPELKINYKRYILFVGSIFNRRFIPQSINGFVQFAKKYSDFQFIIIGKNHTQPFQDIGRFVTQANNDLSREAIIWRGYAGDKELVGLYKGAFATLWLSSYEGFGLPVLESMACGTPVVTSRYGSLPEVGGDVAIYIDNPQDPAMIANALSNLADDKIFYENLVQKSQVQTSMFSWHKCAEKTLTKLILCASLVS